MNDNFKKMLESRAQNKRKVASVIGRGSQLIRKRGWCIGALRDDSGRLCLMGAIEEAAKGETRAIRYKAYDEVNKVLRRENASIHTWNDEQTSEDRVADLLELVAKKVDPTYVLEEICQHGYPRCKACKYSPGCSSQEDGHPVCAGSWHYQHLGHAFDCPDLKVILQKLKEAKLAHAVSSS